MVFKNNFLPAFNSHRACHTAAMLVAGAALSGLFSHQASAQQVVYSSLTGAVTPAAQLPFNSNGNVNSVADDYTTTFGSAQSTFFNLTSLTFVGGINFSGPADGTNNLLRFRFLNQFGTPSPVDFTFAFAAPTMGTITVNAPTGSIVSSNGVLVIQTVSTSTQGFFAFSNATPQQIIGFNDPNRSDPAPAPGAPGVRAFALSGTAVGAPEPASVALLLFGAGGTVVPFAVALRRKIA